MRAPPASNRPMIGARAFSAMSWILMIFWACVSESEPPNTVKSLAKANTVRPLTVPQPVTTPSPGNLRALHAELGGAVLDEHVEFLERALVHQEFETLAGGQFAALVLRLDPGLAAAFARALAALFELFKNVFHVRRYPPVGQNNSSVGAASPATVAPTARSLLPHFRRGRQADPMQMPCIEVRHRGILEP